MVPDQEPLEYLACADPELADRLRASLDASPFAYPEPDIRFLVDEILEGILVELSFGQSYARGISALVARVDFEQVHRYCALVDDAGRHGPALGKLFAEALVEVVAHAGGRFADRFRQVTDIMLTKGAYTLKDPLRTLSEFLAEGDAAGAQVYLDLLAEVFARPLTYNRCLVISKRLPRLAAALPESRRSWQLKFLKTVMAVDDTLMEPFCDGLEKGADLLDEKSLARFVAQGLEAFRRERTHGIRFFELRSLPGLEACRALQVAVPLSDVRARLERYLLARVGKGLTVRTVADMPAAWGRSSDTACVYFDGGTLFFKEVFNRFSTSSENRDLYLCLARLESGCAEFGTFDFDLEKAADGYGIGGTVGNAFENLTDLERFVSTFDIPDLAADLFTLVEHGRIRQQLAVRYPGLDRMARKVIGREVNRLLEAGGRPACFYRLYMRIALGMEEGLTPAGDRERRFVAMGAEIFHAKITADAPVEAVAGVVRGIYPLLAAILGAEKGDATGYRKMKMPFGRKIRPALYNLRFREEESLARRIKQRMQAAGLKAYRADLARLVREKHRRLTVEDLKKVIVKKPREAGSRSPSARAVPDLERISLADCVPEIETQGQEATGDDAHAFRYPEWDSTQNDYLVDHARLTEKSLTGRENGFYPRVLRQHRGLVTRIKNAFELLKPEGIQILRQWIEGDDFDYRAMLDFALDKRAGCTPSERLYIKRMKSARDVAVMLLVDLSRSTANTVEGAAATVLDVEKEAIVLFCEALEVVGDTYAISGFSGTGRLGVDFYTLKGFPEAMGPDIRARINAMAPQRNTRMGAAIRHAAHRFHEVDAAVKLLIILGDGYPNDTGYKKHYAIADTRKAIFEARSLNIYTHGITVNIRSDNAMDDLFGPVHHTAISDVRELPEKLWRIYSSLTR